MAEEKTELEKKIDDNLTKCWKLLRHHDKYNLFLLCIKIAWSVAAPEMNDQMRLELSAKLFKKFSAIWAPDEVKELLED